MTSDETDPDVRPLHVSYRQKGLTSAYIEIEGVDASRAVTRFSFDHSDPMKIPKVFLELRADRALPDGIDVEAIVHVREVVQEEPADAMLRFLEPLDPAQLEKDCLASMELGGPTTYGEAVIAVLRAYASGVKPT